MSRTDRLRPATGGERCDRGRGLCGDAGVTEPTAYRWKKQFVGTGVPEIRRLKQLADENSKLGRRVADLTLDRSLRTEMCSSESGEA